jgi:acylphosphatase
MRARLRANKDLIGRVGGACAETVTADPSSLGARGKRHDGDMTQVRMTAWVHGRVQGVGFRWWARSRARELGLVGHAANLSDGRVEVVAEGSREACERLLAALRSGSTPGQVEQVTERFTNARGGATSFVER